MTEKTIPTSVRLSPRTKALLKKEEELTHIKPSILITMAIERCLRDHRWSASINNDDSGDRERQLLQAISDLCHIVNELAFAVESSLESRSRQRRIESKKLVADARIDITKIIDDLDVH